MMFEPTRNAGLARLQAFVPKAGRDYAARRNSDIPGHPHVSGLSPYLRHRIVTEAEVLEAVLRHHPPSGAEKFIQEVYWRTYWKGWLEQRPSVWTRYRAGVASALDRVQTEAGLRAQWEDACTGHTGIDGFDHWAQKLVETGYLHNHARMWFASIWIFTLRLPWELGADFFLRHLLDGDPASNTLGWRWVAGLQTVGKTYLARTDNIAKFTDGRFRPTGLATFAAPLDGPPHPDRQPLPSPDQIPSGKTALLLTEDDLSPDWLLNHAPEEIAVFDGTRLRSPLSVSTKVTDFVSGAIADLESRVGTIKRLSDPDTIQAWAQDFDHVLLPHPTVGATADALAGLDIPSNRQIRPYDQAAWPHAKAGFFKFKAKIPDLLRAFDRQPSLL